MANGSLAAIQLSNLAVEFIDNHVDADFHPSLPNPDVKYDPAADVWRLQYAITR